MHKVFIASVLCLALVLTGCTFSSVMTQLEKYIPIALQAIESIISVLVQGGIIKTGQASTISNDVTMASSSLQDVENAVAAYNAAPAADKNTKLGVVITSLEAAQTELAQGIKDVGLNGNSPAALATEAGLQVIITTLATIEVNLPTPTPAPAWVHANAAKAKFSFNPFGMFKSNYPGQFKNQFNGALAHRGFSQFALK